MEERNRKTRNEISKKRYERGKLRQEESSDKSEVKRKNNTVEQKEERK